MTENYYVKNAAKDVFSAVKVKNNQSYLPWANAWQFILESDNQVNWDVCLTESFVADQDGVAQPCQSTLLSTPYGHFVEVDVISKGITHKVLQPVFNYKNEAVNNPSCTEVNKSIHRALAKGIALHGIGIGVFTKDQAPIPMDFIDYNQKREKLGQNEYLSWAWAWDAIKRRDPNANFEVVRFGPNKMPYLKDSTGVYVKVSVTYNGITRSESLPMLGANKKPLADSAITVMEINKAIQRALTKAIALHGIGLDLYSGEDLPDAENAKDDSGEANSTNEAGTASTENAKAQGLAEAATQGSTDQETQAKPAAKATGKASAKKDSTPKAEAAPASQASVAEAEVAGSESAAEPVADQGEAQQDSPFVNEKDKENFDRIVARFNANPKSAQTLERVAKTMLSPSAMEHLEKFFAEKKAA